MQNFPRSPSGATTKPIAPHGTACDQLRGGAHVGSTALRAFVEHAQPDLVLCGHIHEARATDTIGNTNVVNPGSVSAGPCALVAVNGGVEIRFDGAESTVS